MCVVSMIGDHYRDKFNPPPFAPPPQQWEPFPAIVDRLANNRTVTREEFELLKREIVEMKALLKKAKLYDQANGEPDCETDEKWELLKKIAEKVGVTLDV